MTDDQLETTSDDASKDEYEIALDEGIDDESLLEDPGARKFAINSYGVDYTVDTLVKRMRGGSFKIPEFQRRFVWSIKHSSKFIESLLMGLPVPGIFLYKEAGTNEHLVIDGQQRLKSLQSFYDQSFGDRKFRLTGVRDPWNGKTYSELDTADVLKLDDSVVHATVFQQDSPKDVLDSIYYVFERINSGGMRLSPQEIRNCVSLGKFIYMVKRLNENEDWRIIFGPPNKRAKDEELIVRFFALYEKGKNYARPMNTFLNDFSAEMNKSDDGELERLAKCFEAVVKLVNQEIGSRAFRLIRALNAAVFDAVMVGIARRLERAELPGDGAIAQAYDGLLANKEFRAACERATADEENVKTRIRLATEAFEKT